jgi:GntR family transcriptional regulator/MocR family aminotransferase
VKVVNNMAQAELSVATVQQPALAEFINQGHFMSHVRKMRKSYQKRQQFLASFLQENIGEMATISGTEGGLNFILNLPAEIDDAKLSEKLSVTGIIAHPLGDYYLHQNTTNNSRLNGLVIGFACAPAAQLEKSAITLIEHLDVINGD